MSNELTPADPVLAKFQVYAEAGIRRVSFEVNGEQVNTFLRDGRLRAVCTCGASACEHEQLVWSFLGTDGKSTSVEAFKSAIRSSLRPPALGMSSDGLLDALDELLLATTRAGISAPDSVSIRQALEALVSSVPAPHSLSLSRWIGRFHEALAAGEVGELSRLLDGARRWVDEQRAGERAPAALARRHAWLGGLDGPLSETIADSVLVELGREWLNGTSRTSIERRYLLELHTGEIWREERRRGEQEISVGPCPRVVHVAFGEADSAVYPRRIRPLQYTVSPSPTQEHWRRSVEVADQHVADLARRYVEGARACPGMSEPFVLFSPETFDSGSQAAVCDRSGDCLLLVDSADAPAADAVRAISQDAKIVWLGGRLLGLARGFALRPISVLLEREGLFFMRRVT